MHEGDGVSLIETNLRDKTLHLIYFEESRQEHVNVLYVCMCICVVCVEALRERYYIKDIKKLLEMASSPTGTDY